MDEELFLKKKSKKKAARKPKVERLPPTAEAARDEGPRLLPLSEKTKEPSRLEHYLDLADAALETKGTKDRIP